MNPELFEKRVALCFKGTSDKIRVGNHVLKTVLNIFFHSQPEKKCYKVFSVMYLIALRFLLLWVERSAASKLPALYATESCFQHLLQCLFVSRNPVKLLPLCMAWENKRLQWAEEAVCINTILVVNCLFQWISDI